MFVVNSSKPWFARDLHGPLAAVVDVGDLPVGRALEERKPEKCYWRGRPMRGEQVKADHTYLPFSDEFPELFLQMWLK